MQTTDNVISENCLPHSYNDFKPSYNVIVSFHLHEVPILQISNSGNERIINADHYLVTKVLPPKRNGKDLTHFVSSLKLGYQFGKNDKEHLGYSVLKRSTL